MLIGLAQKKEISVDLKKRYANGIIIYEFQSQIWNFSKLFPTLPFYTLK